jgi:DNA-binding CsgD family transcriptional regulator
MAIGKTDWNALSIGSTLDLAPDEAALLTMLKDGRSTPQIARLMGIPRSTIWGRALKLKARLLESQAAPASSK